MAIIISSSTPSVDWSTWAGFYDLILPEVNGVTAPQVDSVLRQVAIEFFEETQVHVVDLDPIDVVANTATYILTSPIQETEPYMVKAAWFNDRPLDLAPLDALNASNTYWPSTTSTEAWAFTHKQPDEIVLYPSPDTALEDGLRVQVVLRPTQDATGVIQWAAQRYAQALAAGVKGRLMAMPDRPWTRPDFASLYVAQYEAAKTRATIDANRSMTRGALQVRPRPSVRWS